MIQYEAVRDFEIVFADPPDAAMLLKPVLSKESIRAIEMDRGDEYTHVSDSEIVNSGNGESDSRSESQDRRVRQQQNATTTDNYSTKDTRAQPRCTKLLGKELMGFFGEDTDLEEKEKRLDDDLRRQQHDFRIQRTFLSEATIQLARLDLEYRMRSRAEAADGKQDKAGSQKRKAGHTFANDEDYVGPENDGEVTGEDEGGDDETLNEHNIYR
ncbi:hypothetical protein BGZ95_000131 [Linnemannia exigua]|uniref:Uncharacterized protein n=1 Tax=Linnemannia exigua TaxID=604196 RepID=A0AAD4D8Q1_9FUNG|nr:hypothetical protein BGZ95_000131 [Linnemannia exigua]